MVAENAPWYQSALAESMLRGARAYRSTKPPFSRASWLLRAGPVPPAAAARIDGRRGVLLAGSSMSTS